MGIECDYTIKTLLVGDSGVGKSSIMNQLIEENFSDTYQCTIGVDYKTVYIDIMNKAVKFMIWDTAGQERFKSITKIYYRGAQVILFVFDLTDRVSFENIVKWVKETEDTAPDSCLKILVGNKCDFDSNLVNIINTDKKREINRNEAEEFASIYGFVGYYEMSAKRNIGITDCFYKIAEHFININKNIPSELNKQPHFIKLKKNNDNDKNSSNFSCFC